MEIVIGVAIATSATFLCLRLRHRVQARRTYRQAVLRTLDRVTTA